MSEWGIINVDKGLPSQKLDELKECNTYAIIQHDCVLQAFFRIVEGRVHLNLDHISRQYMIKGYAPRNTGLIFSLDDFKKNVVWMLQKNQIAEVICRAENYGDLLIVCASRDNVSADKRIDEFFKKHKEESTGSYHDWDKNTAQKTTYFFSLNNGTKPASDTYSVYIDAAKPVSTMKSEKNV